MEKPRVKVLSYNIHKGFNRGSRHFVLRGIREAIQSVHPDLVFLQEVLGAHEGHRIRYQDWPERPQFEFLAHELWPHFAYGKNAVYSSGHHGNAILSKFPFSLWENIDISTNRLEKRGLLHGIVELPRERSRKKRSLHLICVHLGLFESERREQIRRLCARIESHVHHTAPLVIAGDFNDWRAQASSILEKTLGLREAFTCIHGSPARTFPSWLPALKLDRIYYRGASAQVARCLSGAPWNRLSDHTALYAELQLSS